jgi:hypothetical protein
MNSTFTNVIDETGTHNHEPYSKREVVKTAVKTAVKTNAEEDLPDSPSESLNLTKKLDVT